LPYFFFVFCFFFFFFFFLFLFFLFTSLFIEFKGILEAPRNPRNRKINPKAISLIGPTTHSSLAPRSALDHCPCVVDPWLGHSSLGFLGPIVVSESRISKVALLCSNFRITN
jgi:hypothetical protein